MTPLYDYEAFLKLEEPFPLWCGQYTPGSGYMSGQLPPSRELTNVRKGCTSRTPPMERRSLGKRLPAVRQEN